MHYLSQAESRDVELDMDSDLRYWLLLKNACGFPFWSDWQEVHLTHENKETKHDSESP